MDNKTIRKNSRKDTHTHHTTDTHTHTTELEMIYLSITSKKYSFKVSLNNKHSIFYYILL